MFRIQRYIDRRYCTLCIRTRADRIPACPARCEQASFSRRTSCMAIPSGDHRIRSGLGRSGHESSPRIGGSTTPDHRWMPMIDGDSGTMELAETNCELNRVRYRDNRRSLVCSTGAGRVVGSIFCSRNSALIAGSHLEAASKSAGVCDASSVFEGA